MFIVELESGVWLSFGEGDPPRTLLRKNAAEYKTFGGAAMALDLARIYRPFKKAEIVPMMTVAKYPSK